VGIVCSVVEVGLTAFATLVAVLLGGWLTVRAQDRLWARDQARQWRDIRLKAYTDFIGAFREFVALLLVPSTVVKAVARQDGEGDLMPFFDEAGSPYRERLEVTKTAVRLVAGSASVIEATNAMVHNARSVAAARASHDVGAVPAEQFRALWAAERAFVQAARAEIGLALPDR
jgi:hypothetical protein